jgi:phosphatidylglycerol:prolipoprotein diacylglycerol transferase
MFPYLEFGVISIPVFGIMAVLGVGAGALMLLWICKIKKADPLDPFLGGCVALVGVVIGANLLRPITRIPTIIRNWSEIRQAPFFDVMGWLFGETVFYCGLIGALIVAYIYCRAYKISFLRNLDLYAAVIPVGHAFGRVGCFLAGCCYGREVSPEHPLGITFPTRTNIMQAMPTDVPLLPVQLFEAAGNLLIAAIIIVYIYATREKTTPPGRAIAIYGLLYGVQRFILEFFRGDAVRGIYGGISTSQYISIALVIASALLFWLCSKHLREN